MAKATATAQSPVVGKIVGNAKDIHDRMVGGRKPSMKFPLRALSNVRYAQAFAKHDLNYSWTNISRRS